MRNVMHMTMNNALGSDNIPQFHVGDRLAKARETTGLSQTEFGETIGASRSTVARWESGKGVRKSTLLLYSMATRVPLEWLETGFVHPPGLEPGTHWLTVEAVITPIAA